MQVELIDQIGHFNNLKTAWDTVYLADPHATVFVSWPWVRGWIDATSDRWLILAVKDDKPSSYVGFLPITLRDVKTNRFISFRQLHFAGTPTSDHKGFICQPEHQDIAIKSLAIFIQKHIRWDYLLAEEVWDPRLDDFLSEFSSLKYRIEERTSTVCPYVSLPQTWDDYLMELGYNNKRDLRRQLRNIEGLENFHVSHIQQNDFDSSVEIMDRLTWGAQPDQKRDIFRGKNITPQFRYCFENGFFWGAIFWHGQVPISTVNAFIDSRKGYFGAYNTGYNPDYAKFSPGKVILGFAIRYAIENGFREFDFLRGSESYKTTIFHAKERYNRNVMVTNLRSPKILGIRGMHISQRAKRLVRHILLPPPRPAPREVPEFSIGIYTGATPWQIVPADHIVNPVLTHGDVTDTQASFVSDPFMVRVEGIWYMFFEVMNSKTGKGEIALATSADGFTWQYQKIVLVEPFHLSYPYVFVWDHGYYMIPESWKAGEVRLYRATEFPTQWTWVATLLELPYVLDSSVFYSAGRWWMFAETGADPSYDTLRLYSAQALTGPWVEHPQSPVVSGNPHIARPAGRVLVDGDRIIRFAQDCSPKYGLQVSAFEVRELTPKRYAERPLVSSPILGGTGAGWNSHGMHHIDSHRLEDGRWIACVDGWRSLLVE